MHCYLRQLALTYVAFLRPAQLAHARCLLAATPPFSDAGHLLLRSKHCVETVGGAQGTKFAKADKNLLAGLFKYLDGCLEQIVKDNELGALKQALKVTPHLCPSPQEACKKDARVPACRC